MAFFIKTTEGLERLNGVYIKPSAAEKTITANGTYDSSDDGVDGYSSVSVAVPQRAANAGGLTISDSALELDTLMDSADPFEIVVCIRIDPDDVPSLPSNKVIFGNYEALKRACYIQVFKENGHIVIDSPFLWGTHDWDEGNNVEVFLRNAENVLDCDGETWNYLKIVKTADLKYQMWYSSDGMTYTLAEETQLPNNMTNLYSFTPIIPAPQDVSAEKGGVWKTFVCRIVTLNKMTVLFGAEKYHKGGTNMEKRGIDISHLCRAMLLYKMEVYK